MGWGFGGTVQLWFLLGSVFVVRIISHVFQPESFGFPDERYLFAVLQHFPALPQAFGDLGVVHVWRLFHDLSPLDFRPHHKRVHRSLYVSGRCLAPVWVYRNHEFTFVGVGGFSTHAVRFAVVRLLHHGAVAVCVVSPNYHPRASALCASEVHPLFPELQAAFLTTSWLFHLHDIMGSAPITSSPLRPREPMQRALTLNALPSGPTLRETRISLDKPNRECECQHVNKRNQTNRSHQMFQNPLWCETIGASRMLLKTLCMEAVFSLSPRSLLIKYWRWRLDTVPVFIYGWFFN